VAATTTAPSVDEVRRIVAIESPVLRNLEITACYARLAAAFAQRTSNGGGDGANWCAYATWASKQAGRSIRGEDWLDQFGRRLGGGRWLLHPFATLWRRLLRRGLFQPATRLGRLTAQLHTPFDAFERASDAVARGNLRVFEEIGLEFARYLHVCLSGEPPPCEQFLDGLRPGDPPDGQRYLRQAFTHYEQARLTDDAKARAQLTVLANLEIGLHEQTRLQPEIRDAMDAGTATTQDLGDRTLAVLFPGVWGLVRRPVAAMLGLVAGRLQRAASAAARDVVTDSFLVLSLPGRVLALGANLADEVPDALRSPAGTELGELLARYEPVPPEPDDCGARDWSELDQRMHYIVHLFCAFHAREELFRPPFTEAQLATLARGELPGGEL
jgi:hypothetical protein